MDQDDLRAQAEHINAQQERLMRLFEQLNGQLTETNSLLHVHYQLQEKLLAVLATMLEQQQGGQSSPLIKSIDAILSNVLRGGGPGGGVR